MATTPRRNGHASPPSSPVSTPSIQRRLDGLWYKKQWWCNCPARQKASNRRVSKETRNQGRHFWTCETSRCSFFLWADQAAARERLWTSNSDGEPLGEEQAPPVSCLPRLTQQVLTSCGIEITPSQRRRSSDQAVASSPSPSPCPSPKLSRSESRRSPENEPRAWAQADMQVPVRQPVLETPDAGLSKRNRDIFEDAAEEFSDWDSDEERQLAVITDRSAEKVGKYPALVTPQETPALARAAEIRGGLTNRPVARKLFTTAEAKRQKRVSFEETNAAAVGLSNTSTDGLPTPGRTPASDRSHTLSLGTPSNGNEDITEEVMALLRNQGVDHDVLQSVHNLLVRSASRAKGLALGQESAQKAVQEGNEKMAKVQQRIVALENKNKVLSDQRTNMRAGIIKVWDDN